jgi:hypothetical protein
VRTLALFSYYSRPEAWEHVGYDPEAHLAEVKRIRRERHGL